VALNPVIKFTTLFGVLAVGLATKLDKNVALGVAAAAFVGSLIFAYRSFYGMRIDSKRKA
jgi:K(+)-stimulated pyrophosphate-energized sodium pump